jgi:hypothetical protein
MTTVVLRPVIGNLLVRAKTEAVIAPRRSKESAIYKAGLVISSGWFFMPNIGFKYVVSSAK